jgi:hypothetical protein
LVSSPVFWAAKGWVVVTRRTWRRRRALRTRPAAELPPRRFVEYKPDGIISSLRL